MAINDFNSDALKERNLQLKFDVESTTLKNLDFIIHPEKPIDWKKLIEVFHLIEMLILSDKLVISGRSVKTVQKKTKEDLVDEFNKRTDLEYFEFNASTDEGYELSASEASSIFFKEPFYTTVNKIFQYKNIVDISDISPAQKDASSPYPISMNDWEVFFKFLKSKSKNYGSWLNSNCYHKDKGGNKTILNGGKAIFYGILEEGKNQDSEKGKEFFERLIKENNNILYNHELLQYLNVGFRTYLNNNLASYRQFHPDKDEIQNNQISNIFFYAPNIGRGKIFDYSTTITFKELYKSVFGGYIDAFGLISGKKQEISEYFKSDWQLDEPFPFLSLMLLMKLKYLKDSTKKMPNIFEMIDDMKNDEDVKETRNCIAKALHFYYLEKGKNDGDHFKAKIEFDKMIDKCSEKLKVKCLEHYPQLKKNKAYGYLKLGINITGKLITQYVPGSIILLDRFANSNFLKRIVDNHSKPKFGLISDTSKMLQEWDKQEIKSLAGLVFNLK